MTTPDALTPDNRVDNPCRKSSFLRQAGLHCGIFMPRGNKTAFTIVSYRPVLRRARRFAVIILSPFLFSPFRRYSMTLTVAHLQPIVALIAGILILLIPRLLNFIVAIYLILVGVMGLGLIK